MLPVYASMAMKKIYTVFSWKENLFGLVIAAFQKTGKISGFFRIIFELALFQ